RQPRWSKALGHGHRVPHSLHLLQQPADRARSAPGWVLHLPLALGMLVTQAQEETFAAGM
ncbi:MAG: hypothetical protein WAN75_05530, partial [Xanthobacteraceae bacterium]